MVVLIERLWALLENLFSLKTVLWFIINWGIIWHFLPCATKASIAWKCFSHQNYLISLSFRLTSMCGHIRIAISWTVRIQINIHPPISDTSSSVSTVEGIGANPSCFLEERVNCRAINQYDYIYLYTAMCMFVSLQIHASESVWRGH